MAESFKQLGSQGAPGAAFNYSNTNWHLLGLILETATGIPYGDYVEEHVLKPAGMTHSFYTLPANNPVPLAKGYLVDDRGVYVPAQPPPHPSFLYASGQIHATAGDMIEFHRALFGGRLLGAAMLERMTTPVIEISKGVHYAYGLISRDIGGTTVYGHSGGTYGFTSDILTPRDAGITVVVLNNNELFASHMLAPEIVKAMLGQPYETPSDDMTFISVPEEILARYVGTYEYSWYGRETNLTFTLEDGRLRLSIPKLSAVDLKALSETKFYARLKGDVYFTFAPDGASVFVDWAGEGKDAPRLAAGGEALTQTPALSKD